MASIKMNEFEVLLVRALELACKEYLHCSREKLLYYAPEHFVQNVIFRTLGEICNVNLEFSQKKMSRRTRVTPTGPKPKRKIRHDVIVWSKSAFKLKAVIEIKKSHSMGDGLRIDAKKIIKAKKGPFAASSAYLVILRRFKSSKTNWLGTFGSWANELNLVLINANTFGAADAQSEWTEAFCTLKAE